MKTMRLKVIAATGVVRISSPYYLPELTIFQFMQHNLAWIAQRQAMITEEKCRAPTFHTGEQHLLWGEWWQLDVSETSGKATVQQFPQQTLQLTGPTTLSVEAREKLLDGFYRQQLQLAIPALLEKWQGIVGKRVNQWGIRKMRTRWGTCNIQAKRIWLSLALAKKPKLCLEYVVVHELVHLHERYHNQRFKSLMTQFMPDWPLREARLNETERPDQQPLAPQI